MPAYLKNTKSQRILLLGNFHASKSNDNKNKRTAHIACVDKVNCYIDINTCFASTLTPKQRKQLFFINNAQDLNVIFGSNVSLSALLLLLFILSTRFGCWALPHRTCNCTLESNLLQPFPCHNKHPERYERRASRSGTLHFGPQMAAVVAGCASMIEDTLM